MARNKLQNNLRKRVEKEAKSVANGKGISSFGALVIIILMLLLYNGDILSFLEPATEVFIPAEGELVYHVIDVGQGDATFVKTPSMSLLIDGGDNGEGQTVLNYLDSIGVTELDAIVATHPHADHIGGLVEVMEEIPVKEVYMPDLPIDLIPTSQTFENFLDVIDQKGIEAYLVTSEMVLNFSDVSARVLPVEGEIADLNAVSLVTKISLGEVDFLSTGDMEAEGESELLYDSELTNYEVLKLGHHGSDTSSTQEFLNHVNPSSAFITVGIDNRYGHPHDGALRRIREITDIIPRTDFDGSFYYSTDGSSLNLHIGDVVTAVEVK